MTPLLLPPSLMKDGQRARVQVKRKKGGKFRARKEVAGLGQNLDVSLLVLLVPEETRVRSVNIRWLLCNILHKYIIHA